MRRHYVFMVFVAATSGLIVSAAAQERSPSVNSLARAAAETTRTETPDSAKTHGSGSSNTAAATEASLRLEGERRFRTNCGRCHQPPHKFRPRVMATAIRHMRVRAMITDEDMRLILRYMTE